MKYLSKSVEILVAQELGSAQEPIIHDAVVVGSGYGASVAALRLAQAGVGVLVLERGKEYVSGDFPNDIGDAFGHVRLQRNKAHNVDGYESGLYDVRLGEGIGALVGNALGGTSQINAGVVLAPDRRVFDKTVSASSGSQAANRPAQPAWPAPLRPQNGRFSRSLLKGYAKARRELKAELFTESFGFMSNDSAPNGALGSPVKPLKTQRLQELGDIIATVAGSDVSVTVRPARLAVALYDPKWLNQAAKPLTSGCVGCGDCVSGCNQNAKKTLTYTYLPRAVEHGARLFIGVSVLSVRRQGDVWIVKFTRTEGRKSQRESGTSPVHELHARHVVLGAGTLGTSEILFRSRQEEKLGLSACLGKRLSTNGDSLSFGYLLDKRVNGIGVGSSNPMGSGFAVGPTITSMVRIDHKSDVTKSMLIQDGAVPYAVSRLFEEMVATTGALEQLDTCGFKDMPKHGVKSEDAKDWAVLQRKGRTHTQTLLGMGHDKCAGELYFEDGRLQMRYAMAESREVEILHERYLSQVKDQGAIFLRNPAVHPLPRGVSNVLTGPAFGGGAFTVHPLGGCNMADDASLGVVDHLGRVFKPVAPGEPAGLHPGLYVLDGSIVPTSLGANPLFTITALAERAMLTLAPIIAKDMCHSPGTPRTLGDSPAHESHAYVPYAREVGVHFTEAMRSHTGGFQWQGQAMSAHLLLHLPIDDMDLLAADGQHRITIPDQTGAATGDHEQLVARLLMDSEPFNASNRVSLHVESGWVSILPIPEPGRRLALSRWWRTLITWFIVRGASEIARAILEFLGLVRKDPTDTGPNPGFWAKLRSLRRLCGHASEARTMEYRLTLRDSQPRGDSIRTYFLRGTKKVGYPSSWREIWAYVRQLGSQPLERPNVWKSFGELDVVVTDEDGASVGAGVLSLDMLDMSNMHAPQLALPRDTPNALLGLAAYPFWFARLLAKTRLWDFRAPDYPAMMPKELTGRDDVPVPAASVRHPPSWWPTFPCLRIYQGAGGPVKRIEPHTIEFRAPYKAIDEPPEDHLKLKLTRYRQETLERCDAGRGMVKLKTILLLGGLGQSTLSFVATELERKPEQDDDEPNLAEFFYEQGFDVWLLDCRLSPHLDASKKAGNMDQVAQFDIPKAVDRMLDAMAIESNLPADKLQIFAYSHCVGAGSMAMSLLGGFLKHVNGENKLAGVVFSQMQAFTIGSRSLQMRMRLSALARDALNLDYLRLSPVERLPDAMESALDRLFASLPVAPKQECPHERSRWRPRTAICACKRLSGIISPVINHARIRTETHEKLGVYFGRASTSMLAHGARCVESERLVNVDGKNIYLTESNIRNHLRLPVALLNGKDSELFNVESAVQTYRRFSRINPDLRASGAYARPILAKGFAHFDCVVGHGIEMQEQILKPLRRFLDTAWDWQASTEAERLRKLLPSQGSVYPVAPLAGPMLGWSRIEYPAGKPVRVIRVWIEVDERGSDRADWVVTHCVGATMSNAIRLWPVLRLPTLNAPLLANLPTWLGFQPRANQPHISIAIADLEFDLSQDWSKDVTVQMFSLHSRGPEPLPNEPPSKRQAQAYWSTLSDKRNNMADLALRGNPGTVSRTKRYLPPHRAYGQAQATIRPEMIRQPAPADGVAFTAASCRHPGLAFEDQRSGAALARVSRFLDTDCLRPRFMLMLGDQIYADATAGLMDSPSAVERISLRYRQAFDSPAFAELISSISTYMAIDDHEIGDNWSRDELKAKNGQGLYAAACAAFAAYQWAHSPRNGAAPGFNYHFDENGCPFFVLDTRTQRERHSPEPQICAPTQLQALLDWLDLQCNDARPKFVVSGSVLAPGLRAWDTNVAGLSDRYAESWQMAQQQRIQVLSHIAQKGIRNVVFIAGDYHCAVTAHIDLGNALHAYAVVAPPLYAQLPAANTKGHEVLAKETLALGTGRSAIIQTSMQANGDGFVDIRATPLPGGSWRMEVRHHVLQSGDKEPHPQVWASCFTLT